MVQQENKHKVTAVPPSDDEVGSNGREIDSSRDPSISADEQSNPLDSSETHAPSSTNTNSDPVQAELLHQHVQQQQQQHPGSGSEIFVSHELQPITTPGRISSSNQLRFAAVSSTGTTHGKDTRKSTSLLSIASSNLNNTIGAASVASNGMLTAGPARSRDNSFSFGAFPGADDDIVSPPPQPLEDMQLPGFAKQTDELDGGHGNKDTLFSRLRFALAGAGCESHEDIDAWVNAHGQEFLRDALHDASISAIMQPDISISMSAQDVSRNQPTTGSNQNSTEQQLEHTFVSQGKSSSQEDENGALNLITGDLEGSTSRVKKKGAAATGTRIEDGVMRRRRISMLSMTSMRSLTSRKSMVNNKSMSSAHNQVLRKLRSKLRNGQQQQQEAAAANGKSVEESIVDPSNSGSVEEMEQYVLNHSSSNWEPTALVYCTPEQAAVIDEIQSWEPVAVVRTLVMLVLLLFCFFDIPIRIGVGSEHLPLALFIVECIVDLVLIVLTLMEFVMPREIDGAPTTDREAIAADYKASQFYWDLVGLFPLQIVLATLYLTDVTGPLAMDFARVNRMILVGRFVSDYDTFCESRLSQIHPLLMRIFKFVLLILVYALVTAAPMHMVIRADGQEGTKWTNYGGNGSGSISIEYARTFWHSLSVAAGRNFPNPRTENQIWVMTFVSILSLASMSVIIAGVTAMVLALVERTSRLSVRIDEVMHQLTHMRLPSDFIDEVCNYYRNMFAMFNTFDYANGDDFLDDLPDELLNALNSEVHISTVRQIPLFLRLQDDLTFVEEMAQRLEMSLLMPGTLIFAKGEEGSDMFFISKGTASVVGEDGKELATLKEGSFFGEQAILYGKPRSATIIAKTLCQVYALSRQSFEEMIDIRPDALKEILAVSEERKKDTKRRSTGAGSSGGLAAAATANLGGSGTEAGGNKSARASIAPTDDVRSLTQQAPVLDYSGRKHRKSMGVSPTSTATLSATPPSPALRGGSNRNSLASTPMTSPRSDSLLPASAAGSRTKDRVSTVAFREQTGTPCSDAPSSSDVSSNSGFDNPFVRPAQAEE